MIDSRSAITVVKRDQTTQPFTSDKIAKAIRAASADAGVPIPVDEITRAVCDNVAEVAFQMGGRIGVETIQDIVSTALLEPSSLSVANAFIKHRLKRAAVRDERLKPDPTALADYIHVSKYAKWREDLGNRRETREETWDRRLQMDLDRYPNTADDLRWAYGFGKRNLVLASMRSMQFAGDAVLREHNRIYNCLSRDTQFVTDDGVKSFADFRDGDRVRVRTRLGVWASATVRSYGEQQLYNIHITRGSTKKTVRATANHRWYLEDGRVTTSLAVGDRLAIAAPVDFNLDTCSDAELRDWCAGFAAGDGTKQGSKWLLRLCGRKAELAHYFERAGYEVKYWPSWNGDPAIYLPVNEEQERNLPFLEGLMAADGDHTFPSVASSNPETVAWLEQMAPVLGRYTLSRKVDDRSTNFGPRSHPLHFFRFMATSQATYQGQFSHWKVRSIELDTVESVWCLEVDGPDKSFTLPFGLVTGNCSATLIDRPEVFDEILFELLCGCGVGYSVQWRHVNKLPELKFVDDGDVEHFQIPDTIQGWAQAVSKLISSYMLTGRYVEFAFHKIRKKGSKLKVAGGRAPGHLPLRRALDAVRAILHSAQGRRLRPIECHHIICHLACAVLSGGIRRSALICIFSLDDGEMMRCKTGEWWKHNKHLEVCNNSVMLPHGECTREQFERVFEATRQFGEPGVFFAAHPDYLPNPCFAPETLIPVIGRGLCRIGDLEGQEIEVYDGNMEPQKVTVHRTAKNQPLVEVTLSDGRRYRVTPYHKFVLADGTKVEAKDLRPDQALRSALVSVESTQPTTPELVRHARQVAWQIADGTWDDNPRRSVVYLYGAKSQYRHLFSEYTERHGGVDRLIFACDFPNQDKERVPNWVLQAHRDVQLAFIDSYIDADGHCKRDNLNQLICQITSTRRGFLEDLQAMLYNFGVKSRISMSRPAGNYDLPGGNYFCKTTWRLCVSNCARLMALIKPQLVSANPHVHPYNVQVNVSVVSVAKLEERSDVFCFTVPSTNTFMIGAIEISNCVEIGFNPILKITPDMKPILAQMIADGYQIPKASQRLNSEFSAFGHCNLSSIVVNEKFDKGLFLDCARAAAIIGTHQAAYNSLKYLHWASTAILRRDALIGVSMTGMVSRPDLTFNPEVLEEAAEVVNSTNVEFAAKLGIRSAARTTCIKPEGTGTLWAGRVEHGMHGAWSRRGLRRVVAMDTEAAFQHFKSVNPHMCQKKPDGSNVIVFPVESPDSAITREEFYGVKFLEAAKLVQQHWVLPGTMRTTDSPGLTHNVSCTCSVPADEWQDVIDYMWSNREFFTAVSFLPYDGDKRYDFAPNESVETPAEEAYYNSLIRNYKPVDYTRMKEDEDTTEFMQEAACAGGACTL